MKKIKLIYLLIAMLFVGVSCDKFKNTAEVAGAKVLNKMGFVIPVPWQNNYGIITMTATRYNCGGWGPASKSYVLSGGFYPVDTVPNDSFINGGTIGVGGLSTTMSSLNYLYKYVVPNADTSTAQTCFGTTTNFTSAGNAPNGFVSFTTSMYIPKEIQIYSAHCSCSSSPGSHGISKSSNLVINWNTDPNNSLVYIILSYRSGTPSTDVYIQETVPDNGSYTMSSSNFTSIPTGGKVVLEIGRGNSTFFTTSNTKVIQLMAYTLAMHTDVMVP